MYKVFTTHKGHYFLIKNKAVIFGNKHLTWSNIKEAVPFPIYQMKQVHSDIGVEQPQENPPEADAHWISGSNVGLSIYTADCAPLMIVHRDRDKVAAFHCGWRGVAAKLLEKNLAAFEPDPVVRKSLLCFLGPHILWDSFEVEKEVGVKILGGAPTSTDIKKFIREKDDLKWLIDLTGVLKAQIQSQGLRLAGEVRHDTFLSSRYHSARRKCQPTDRQWSLVLIADSPHEMEVLVAKLMT